MMGPHLAVATSLEPCSLSQHGHQSPQVTGVLRLACKTWVIPEVGCSESHLRAMAKKQPWAWPRTVQVAWCLGLQLHSPWVSAFLVGSWEMRCLVYMKGRKHAHRLLGKTCSIRGRPDNSSRPISASGLSWFLTLKNLTWAGGELHGTHLGLNPRPCRENRSFSSLFSCPSLFYLSLASCPHVLRLTFVSGGSPIL